jgi:hypothetical protein
VRTALLQNGTAAADLLGVRLSSSAGRAALVLRVEDSALSISRHAPRICKSQTSVTGAGSL